jgi:polar amino acid transport system substrate-binding protein
LSQSSGSGVIGRLFILACFICAIAFVMLVVVAQYARSVGYTLPVALPAPQAAPPTPPVAVTAAPPTADASGGPTLRAIRARGSLRVGMDTGEPPWTGTPPMYFRNEAGDHDGFDYVLATQIARSLGVPKVDIVHAKYGDLPAALTAADSNVDLLISGYSPTDEAGITWSVPYLEYGLCLVVPKKSKVKSVADLFGKPVGIFDDDAAAADVNHLVKGYTEVVRLEDGYWDQLLEGRFAGFIYDYPYAVAEIATFYKQNPHKAGAFRIAQYNLTDSTYAVGVREGEPDLLGAVNAAITAWRASPDYEAAIRQYLSGGLPVDAPADAKHVHVVVTGESLSLIAKGELGSVEDWPKLWELNKERFPNPNLINVGDSVVLP